MNQQMDKSIEKWKRDELIDFFRRYKEEIESTQTSLEKIKNFMDEHEQTLKELPSGLEQAQHHNIEIQKLNQQTVETKQEIDEIKNDVDDKQKRIMDFFSKLFEGEEAIENSVEKIKKFMDDYEQTLEELPSRLGQAQQHSTEIQERNQKAVETKQEIDEIKNDVDDKQKRITDFFSKLFEGEEAIENKIQIFQADSKRGFDELKAKIEGLLPGATSAGLASSYQEAQKEKKAWPYWIGFVPSLLVLMGAYFYSFVYKSPPTDLSAVIIRATIGFPLIWIAWFCQRSLSQMTRISEEYRHKEKMMRIYDGFSKQIEQSMDAEERKTKKIDLISVTIKAIEKNPAERLDTSTFLDSWKRKKIENKDEQK